MVHADRADGSGAALHQLAGRIKQFDALKAREDADAAYMRGRGIRNPQNTHPRVKRLQAQRKDVERMLRHDCQGLMAHPALKGKLGEADRVFQELYADLYGDDTVKRERAQGRLVDVVRNELKTRGLV